MYKSVYSSIRNIVLNFWW